MCSSTAPYDTSSNTNPEYCLYLSKGDYLTQDEAGCFDVCGLGSGLGSICFAIGT